MVCTMLIISGFAGCRVLQVKVVSYGTAGSRGSNLWRKHTHIVALLLSSGANGVWIHVLCGVQHGLWSWQCCTLISNVYVKEALG